MILKTLGLAALLTSTEPAEIKDSINLNLPEMKNKTEIKYDLGKPTIQYNLPISEKTFLFTEYQKPITKNDQLYLNMPKLTPEEIRFGIKFNLSKKIK